MWVAAWAVDSTDAHVRVRPLPHPILESRSVVLWIPYWWYFSHVPVHQLSNGGGVCVGISLSCLRSKSWPREALEAVTASKVGFWCAGCVLVLGSFLKELVNFGLP